MLPAALGKVFRRPTYASLALVTSAVVFAFATWLPNISLIVEIMGHSGTSLAQKIELPIALLGSITTNFSVLSASYTILIAIFFGINLAMIVYFIRHRIAAVQQSGVSAGFLGVASGFLGIGCAACGSLILTSVLALFGASGVLAFLPLAGGEFGILGVVLLLWSIYMIAKRITDPLTCSS